MHDVSGLPQQSPSALYRVLDGLRIVTMFVEAGWDYIHTAGLDVSSAFPFQNSHLRQISVEQRYCLYSTAFKGLRNWPAGFYDFLDAYRDRENRKDARGVYAELGVLYASWIAQYWQHPAFQFVQDAFDAYLLTHRSLTHSVIRADRYRANPEFAQRFAYVTIAEAARLMGTTQKMIHRLIDSGRLTGYHAEDNPRYILLCRSDILELREHWSNALELTDTAQRSGISEEVVVDLVKAGLLIAEQCPAEGFKRWLFTQAAVEQCLETIRSHAHLVSEQDNVQALGLATAARMLAGIGLNAAGVLRYVLQGILPAYYTGDEEDFSLQSLVFLACDIHRLGEHIKTERDWMGRDDVARYLGIKDTTLKRRVESGLIVPVAVVAGAQYFDRECIEEFVESYVTTDEAAEILGIKPLTVQSWARQGRLPAVTGPDIDGGHAYCFEKQTLVMWRYERLTSGEAQALLNVSKATLHRWVTLGKLTPLQDMGGTQRWFARQDVVKLSRG
jgi:excisionase family DNA binding protein